MTALDQIRQDLEQILAETSATQRALDEREQQLAAAAEQMSQDASVQAAWAHGCRYERSRIVSLIDHQLATLASAGMNAIVLAALRRMVLEVEA